jgi:hypothetical protein
MARDHRLQQGAAELGRLLDQDVDGRAFDRREHQPDVGLRLRRAPQALDREAAPVAAQGIDARQPLAVACVERGQRRAGLEPEDVAQGVGLAGFEIDPDAGRQPPAR